ncbi:unnamed protein product [Larinioides sclopetarius]|uniref:ATP synthase subunit s-like protein n=2 Tax=Larinioides sclopetarius TaxID=280406 RepID=A0AAV1Z394_9ARAC
MLTQRIVSKSRYYLPCLYQQRSIKVRNLPIKYDEFETPYMKTKKPGEFFISNFYAMVQRKWTLADIKNYRRWKRMDEIRNSQRYVSERHKILGPDLATTHFLLSRGGKVKFKGQDEWMTRGHLDNDQIPSSYVPGYFVEELDATDAVLLYEGFENMCNLEELKKLILHDCPFVDDWCLNRMYMFANTLEYLDLSGCKNITERGICTLHVLKKLKTLDIRDTPNIQHKELVSLLLQDVIPRCEVIGINYEDPVLLKRIEKYL